MSVTKIGFVVLGILLLVAAILFWSPRGYGEVSPDAYEVSKALVGACQAKNSERLDAVDALLDEDAASPLEVTEKERQWLEAMIETARGGDWKSAAKSARRMMDDQVRF